MMHCTEKKNMDIEKMFDSDQPTVQSERNPNQTLQFASALCSYPCMLSAHNNLCSVLIDCSTDF